MMKKFKKRMGKIKKSIRAFTLPELLVTVALVTFIAAAGFFYLYNFKQVNALDQAAQSTVAAIRYAQNQAIAGDRGEKWGVHVEKDASDQDYFAIYFGGTFATGTTISKSPYSSGIAVKVTEEVNFTQLSGTIPAKKVIILELVSNPSIKRKIVIYANGLISLVIGTTLGENWQTFGSVGTWINNFFSPYGISVDFTNNKVYVADASNYRIVRFDSGSGGTTFGANWQSFGSIGQGQFNLPRGVSVDSVNNKVYVADTFNNRIVRFDSGSGGTTFGANLQAFGSQGAGINRFSFPWDISVDFTNNKVYVADPNNYRIVRFDSGSGGTTFGANWQSIGSYGSGINQFNSSYYVSVDSVNNKVYVSDSNNSRFVSFDSGSGDTTFGANWQSIISLDTEFSPPNAVTIDPVNNRVYGTTGIVVSFDSGSGGTTFGANWQSIGRFEYGSEPGQFFGPNGISIDFLNNKVYVVDMAMGHIARFDSESP